MKNDGITFMLNLIIAILVIIATLFGIFGNIYHNHHWSDSQLVGQDVVSFFIAVIFLSFNFIKGWRILFVKAGLLGYLIYTYVTFSFGPALNVMFFFYVAILSLSILSFIFHFIQINKIKFENNKDIWFTIGGIYLIIVGVMLFFLWVGDIIGNLKGEPLLVNPTGEPLLEVYALDLGFVIPAFIIGAILLFKQNRLGYILTSIMLVKSTTMGFALIGMTISLYIFGYSLEMFLIYLWGSLGIIGLLLTIFFLRKLKVG